VGQQEYDAQGQPPPGEGRIEKTGMPGRTIELRLALYGTMVMMAISFEIAERRLNDG
jgi:hypothetical protein